jgi:hypothetical protein
MTGEEPVHSFGESQKYERVASNNDARNLLYKPRNSKARIAL